MTLHIPVGIDLGTTFSAAARITEAGRTEMLANARDELLTPSVVHFGDSLVSVGREAVDLSIDEPDRTVENAKRHVGSEHSACQVSGASLPAEAVQGFLLKQIKRDVTNRVGPNFKCVITAPAYFDEPRRQGVANSGLLSGLDVLDIVNEPTAAALAYGEQLGFLDATGKPKAPINLMVYDLGGGTFDVTALRLAPGELVTQATDGDVELGGLNWDDRLAELLWQRYQAVKHPADPQTSHDPQSSHDPGYWRRLANGVKHTLSAKPFALVECEGPAGPVEIPVSRDEFEEATADLLERTLFTTRQVLFAAGWTWGDVDRLLLVGGSTRMPMVRTALERLAKMAPETSVHPDEAVARGAAIYAQSCLTKQGLSSVARELSVTSVSAHSLGVVGVDIATMHKEAVTIIPKNTQLAVHRQATLCDQGQQPAERGGRDHRGGEQPARAQLEARQRGHHQPPPRPARRDTDRGDLRLRRQRPAQGHGPDPGRRQAGRVVPRTAQGDPRQADQPVEGDRQERRGLQGFWRGGRVPDGQPAAAGA